jgi:hypothetical protein
MAGEQEWRIYEIQNMGERIVVQAVLRALLSSHPNPAALHAAWAESIARMWQDYPSLLGNIPANERDLLIQSMQRAVGGYEPHLPPIAS